VHRFRALAALVLAASMTTALAQGSPARAADDESADLQVSLVAFLDGRPLALKLVANYYCDDFAFPVIQCSTQPATIQARATLALLGGIEYVTIYDLQSFNGSYLHVSQDYSTLVTIGWSDRVSSFRARNSETGRFTVDWFYGGANWSFCCNSQVTILNAYDNTFSSVQRT
jgi:hypothetical protein